MGKWSCWVTKHAGRQHQQDNTHDPGTVKSAGKRFYWTPLIFSIVASATVCHRHVCHGVTRYCVMCENTNVCNHECSPFRDSPDCPHSCLLSIPSFFTSRWTPSYAGGLYRALRVRRVEAGGEGYVKIPKWAKRNRRTDRPINKCAVSGQTSRHVAKEHFVTVSPEMGGIETSLIDT